MPESHRVFKDKIYEQLARVTKALAAAKRLELLDLLSQGPRTVDELACQAAISTANASQHLQVLRAAQLVTASKQGLYVEYRVADNDVSNFYVGLRKLAESRLAEMQDVAATYFAKRGDLEKVTSDELVQRVKRGEVTLLDVRPPEEFGAAHITGALSVPIEQLARKLKLLPKDRLVVAYCRGPYCVMAADAVALLRKKGFEAERLELSVVEWLAGGGRISNGTGACA